MGWRYVAVPEGVSLGWGGMWKVAQRKHFVLERLALLFPGNPRATIQFHSISIYAHSAAFSLSLSLFLAGDPTALNINKSLAICTQKSKDTQRIGRQANIKCQFQSCQMVIASPATATAAATNSTSCNKFATCGTHARNGQSFCLSHTHKHTQLCVYSWLSAICCARTGIKKMATGCGNRNESSACLSDYLPACFLHS